MSENTPKQKKDVIEVDKKFFLKFAKQVDEMSIRLKNLEDTRLLDEEIKTLQPKTPNMTRVFGSPDISVEVNFPNTHTLNTIKTEGIKFQSELETLLDKYNVQSMVLKYNRKMK